MKQQSILAAIKMLLSMLNIYTFETVCKYYPVDKILSVYSPLNELEYE